MRLRILQMQVALGVARQTDMYVERAQHLEEPRLVVDDRRAVADGLGRGRLRRTALILARRLVDEAGLLCVDHPADLDDASSLCFFARPPEHACHAICPNTHGNRASIGETRRAVQARSKPASRRLSPAEAYASLSP